MPAEGSVSNKNSTPISPEKLAIHASIRAATAFSLPFVTCGAAVWDARGEGAEAQDRFVISAQRMINRSESEMSCSVQIVAQKLLQSSCPENPKVALG